jgi:hypothetical protein
MQAPPRSLQRAAGVEAERPPSEPIEDPRSLLERKGLGAGHRRAAPSHADKRVARHEQIDLAGVAQHRLEAPARMFLTYLSESPR